MRADTQFRPYKNTLTLALSQRESEFLGNPLPEGEGSLGVVFIDHFEEVRTGGQKKKYALAG